MTTKRSIDELVNIPYSEMTEEEIERVVDYKASIKARDTAYKQTQAEIREWGEKHLAELKKQTEQAQETQEELLKRSAERLAKSK